MPERKILLQPGINTEETATLNAAGWVASNLIRWQDGLLQVIGGWVKFNPTPTVGVARSMHAWGDLSNNVYLAVGTNERLQAYSASVQYDITPIDDTVDLTSPLSTTAASVIVNVNSPTHGRTAGDWVDCIMPTSIGGIIIFGYYKVTEVVDSDNFTITAADTATATVSGGGDVPAFATATGDATVTVTLADHGNVPGDVFAIQISTSVGGLTLIGEFLVETVPDADTFTFEASTTAASDDTGSENGGDVRFRYLLPSGYASRLQLTGWGASGWGLDGWGEASATTAYEPPRIWSLDNFGEILLANPTNLGLYAWTPPYSDSNYAATLVATAPSANTGMFVGMPQAQVIIYGAETVGSQDLLLIRWSDNGDYTDYTPTVTNQAGSYRLSRGSRIVGGMQAAQTALIWTDIDLWAMVYQGAPFVYSITTIAQNCGLIAQNAAAILAANVYWMSLKGFFVLEGNSVGAILCPVWDQVFADLDTDNQDKCLAAPNTPFHEVFFFYPSLSGGTGEIDAYVKMNVTGLWDYGRLERTAWLDQSIALGNPLGVDANGYVQQHETGYTADGSPMTGAFAQSGYADIADGTMIPFVDQIIPDFRFYDSTATAQFSVIGRDYPFASDTTYGPYDISTSSTLVSLRARKRQVAFRVDFDGKHFVRLGAVRYRMASSGRSIGRAS